MTGGDTARFYDALAEDFDADYYGTQADPAIGFDVQLFERLLNVVIDTKSVRLAVELGSGSGHWLQWLTEHGVPAIGVDISEQMCRTAARLQMVSIQADLADLPIRSGTCDLVIAPYCALDHCERFDVAFAEINRIASPDAAVVLMVDNADRFIKRYWHVTVARVRSLKSDPRRGQWLHDVDGTTVSVYTKLFTDAELIALLPGWNLRFVGLGLLSPLVPPRLRKRFPAAARLLLELLGPLERLLCHRFPRRAALLVAIGSRA